MKTIQYDESFNTDTRLPEYFKHFYPDAGLLFFDIETTGFVAKNTTLYLIGALWYEKDKIKIIQWFNEDGKSEKELITAFEQFCKNFTHLVHFNGSGFDIPYLKQKAALLNLPFSMEQKLTQIDIYKEIRPYKKIFALDNMKQVSIESYLGVKRQDIYSGKELIHVYQKYVASPKKELEELLLLHNHDDLLGMPQISRILNYKAFFEKIDVLSVDIKAEDTKFIISFTYDKFAHLPQRISLSENGIYLNALGQKASLSIPIFHGTLKHYFKDYKNYYYLPKEDIAIHKSIAAFVDGENKEKATKNTCYIKKTDHFIFCPDKNFDEVFQMEASDRNRYQTFQSLQQSNDEMKHNYIKNTLWIFI